VSSARWELQLHLLVRLIRLAPTMLRLQLQTRRKINATMALTAIRDRALRARLECSALQVFRVLRSALQDEKELLQAPKIDLKTVWNALLVSFVHYTECQVQVPTINASPAQATSVPLVLNSSSLSHVLLEPTIQLELRTQSLIALHAQWVMHVQPALATSRGQTNQSNVNQVSTVKQE
jgi:hypothetical protein